MKILFTLGLNVLNSSDRYLVNWIRDCEPYYMGSPSKLCLWAWSVMREFGRDSYFRWLGEWWEKPGKNPVVLVGLSPALDALSAATYALRSLLGTLELPGLLESWAFSAENAGKEWPWAMTLSPRECRLATIFSNVVYIRDTSNLILANSLSIQPFKGLIVLLMASETNVVRHSAYSAEKPGKKAL